MAAGTRQADWIPPSQNAKDNFTTRGTGGLKANLP